MATDPAPATGIRVSVCMATYCGEKYVREQIQSILTQLRPNDELVVVDDASTDSTADVVAAMGDDRIRLHRLPENRGYVRTFETALQNARGAYLLLSDQDDVWPEGRLDAMVEALERSPFAAGNYSVLGGASLPPARWPLSPSFDGRPRRNLLGIMIGYRPYFGCGMGMTRAALNLVLPIPDFFFESHDLWIASVANVAHRMRHLEQVVVERRLHDSNQTPLGWRPIGRIVRARIMLARGIRLAQRRVRLAQAG